MAVTVNTAIRTSKRILAIAGLIPACAGAGDWQVTPTLTLQERFSDNVALSASNKESSFLTEVTPGLKLNSKGARGSVSVDYGLQGLLYSHDSDANALNHQLTAALKSELVDDSFLLDANARIGQQATSQVSGVVGVGNYNTGVNRTETRSASIAPSWRGRIGSTAHWDARWQLTYAGSDNNTLGDTIGNDLSFSLKSGTAFNQVPWSLSLRSQKNDGNATASRTSSISGTVGYIFTAKTRLNLTLGVDDNNGSTSTANDASGGYWNLGLTWTPTPRTNLTASAGRRYNGNSYGLNFLHRTRMTTWGLNYNESLSDTFSQITGTSAFDVYSCGASLVIVPAGTGSPDTANCGSSPALPGQLLPTTQLVNDTTLNKTLSGTATYQTGKSTFSANINRVKRELLTAGTSDDTYSLGGNWTLRLNPRMSSALSINSSHAETGASKSDDWTLAWILTRTLSKSATGALEARRLERGSDSTTGAYKENALSARLNMSF